ncbi:MAG: hypothetical protein COY66_03340 [Candidatus Kerfeldbacteria bacterium CG_4_10_14_0_8_um_filter_42_10]|uniref:CDP-2,3-bis-(O-geranylgeranyl)-sn-glycerol synthase n=1 Tax=Candidatus Kerfeldbacteria bacterium CG_4_10_14_0_8_um_filter_42_10 TaxID=2014248 RepID=A0A2M7RIX7_9BACT|nr:MAG: hypothetical protein COY66_03340 [Candidatus Kerfeldbacteria bacterium CG_4_10_14_0_8_um_filter_42_10]
MFFLLQCVYLMLPGIFANSVPVLVKKINVLNYPVDFNKKWIDQQPILGSHKTWRGLIFGTLAAIGIVAVQKQLWQIEAFESVSILPYQEHSAWSIGFLMGFGVLFGDMLKSFIKRRVKIRPGDKFIPWDQTDSVLGGLIFISFLWIPPWSVIITLLLLSFVLHIIIRHLGYYLGINSKKW